jgi:hypothetical protein
VNHSVRLEADDACAILQLARYAEVRLVSDQRDGPTAGTRPFPALEFLARLLAHIPDRPERWVHTYGAYSARRRARWRQAGILTDTRSLAAISPAADGAMKATIRISPAQRRQRSGSTSKMRFKSSAPRFRIARSAGQSQGA